MIQRNSNASRPPVRQASNVYNYKFFCDSKWFLIFCNNSFFTASGTRVRALGVTVETSVSMLTLEFSLSLTASLHSILTSSLQPHSSRRLLSSSLNLNRTLSLGGIKNGIFGNASEEPFAVSRQHHPLVSHRGQRHHQRGYRLFWRLTFINFNYVCGLRLLMIYCDCINVLIALLY